MSPAAEVPMFAFVKTLCPQKCSFVKDSKSGYKPGGANVMISFWSSSCLIASVYLIVLTPLLISFKLSTAVVVTVSISLAF